MKINTQVRDVQSSGTTGTTSTFKSSDITHIFNLLATSLYSDPIKALMRELGANAKDAHEMAGKPTAVWECHIPTRLEPYFGVRDYGTGLSHAFMMDNYTDIGYSDKRDSDDAIGGFGIGRLSAFSYTDAYTVESIQSGQQRIYSVHLGSAGIPVVVQLGNTLHTTEPDGFHVKVPVKDDDLYTFEDKGKRVYAHFDPQPKFNKEDYAFKKQIQVMGPDKTWWVDAGQNSFKVVMGGVAYPVSNGEIGVSPYSYNLPDSGYGAV